MLHAALFAIATGSAHASEHTTWHWPEGEHRRYYLESHGVVLNFLPLYAPRNHITRFSRYEVALVADCAASNKRIGRQQDVRCDIEDVALRISPMARDAHQAGPTLTQLQALKEGLYVQATFKDNGTMVAFDLEGLPDKMERDRRVQQDLRLLVQRTFVGLQLARPTSDDWSKPWIEKSALITQPIGRRDAVSRLEHTPTVNAERGVVQITTSGTVTMRTSGGGANTHPTIKGETGGVTMWDAQTGSMVGRQWFTHLAGAGMVYTDGNGERHHVPQTASQAGLVLRIDGTDEPPAVGPWAVQQYQGRSFALVQQKIAESSASSEDPR